MAKFIPTMPKRHQYVIPFGKARLYLRRGIWCCKAAPFAAIIGHGYTPKEAYQDWIDQHQLTGPLAA